MASNADDAVRLNNEAMALLNEGPDLTSSSLINALRAITHANRLIEIAQWFADRRGDEDVRLHSPVAYYLKLERQYLNYTVGGTGRDVFRTGRQILLRAMTANRDRSWSVFLVPGFSLVHETLFPLLRDMLANDQHLPSVVAALGYLSGAKLPVSMIPDFVQVVRTLKNGLLRNPGPAEARASAAIALQTFEGVLEQAQIKITQPGGTEPDPAPPDPSNPSGRVVAPPMDWKPWIALGVAGLALAGVWRWRQTQPTKQLPSA